MACIRITTITFKALILKHNTSFSIVYITVESHQRFLRTDNLKCHCDRLSKISTVLDIYFLDSPSLPMPWGLSLYKQFSVVYYQTTDNQSIHPCVNVLIDIWAVRSNFLSLVLAYTSVYYHIYLLNIFIFKM
jgi:hypothetical protein